MKRLTDQRLVELARYLQESGLNDALHPELLDHLACEAEERLWAGQTIEQVIGALVSEVDPGLLKDLNIERKHLLASEDSLNDIVFENRNKQYGAYALRHEYKRTVQRATMMGVGMFLMIFLLPELYARLMPAYEQQDIVFSVDAESVRITPDKVPALPPEKAGPGLPGPSAPSPALPEQSKYLLNQLPVVNEASPTDGLAPSSVGDRPLRRARPAGRTDVLGIPLEEEAILFAEQQPEFVGGEAAFSDYLKQNLNYPRAAALVGVQGKVLVEFTIGKDGTIEDPRISKGIGFGCDEEALRVVKRMPRWLPGRQSGREVRVRYTLPILFRLN